MSRQLFLVAAFFFTQSALSQELFFFSGFEPDPVSVALNVSPESPNPGAASSFIWTVTGNFDTCTPTETLFRTAQPPAFPPPIGWATEAITPASPNGRNAYVIPESMTVSLFCSGPGGKAEVAVLLNTDCPPDQANVPASCQIREGLCPTYGAGDDQRAPGQRWFEFQQPFNLPWPGNSGVNAQIRVPTDQFIALEFDATSTEGQAGRIATERAVIGGEKSLSISECPGDFDVAPECLRFGVTYNLFWANKDASGDVPFGHCPLDPGKTYYLNSIFAEPETTDETICENGSYCIALLQTFLSN